MPVRPVLSCSSLLLVLLSVSSVAGGCGKARGDGPNLLLVVVDTLRQDHLECYGYDRRPTSPALAALAAESIRMKGLTGVSSWTLPSFATLFSGMPPARHKVARMQDPFAEELTLARVFKDEGYATGCVISNVLLTSQRLGVSTGYFRGYDSYDEEIARRASPHLGTTAQQVTDHGLAWLSERDATEPWFLTVLYFDPHVVYEDHPEYGFADPGYSGPVRPAMERQELRKIQESCTPADREQLAAYYDSEIRAVDDAIARLLAELRKRPDAKETIVVFTTDHGEELAERGYIGHTVSLNHELVDLPLIVHLPENPRAGTVVEARRSQSDLFATLLDLCGIAVPAGRGRSFAGMLLGQVPAQDEVVFSEVDFAPTIEKFSEKQTRKRAVIAEGFKLVLDLKDESRLLYDLASDPDELTNLAEDASHAETRERLAGLIQNHDWLVRD